MRYFTTYSTFFGIIIISNCKCTRIGVSDKNNVEKSKGLGNFYPDWVPFKNKHGDELGEFIQIPKSKPKKRLALPKNFILRAIEADEGDYYDKGQEEGRNDYFDKKEWSDLNRPEPTLNENFTIDHTNISDIDGVLNIITNAKPNILAEKIKKIENSADTLKINENKDLFEEINENDKTSESKKALEVESKRSSKGIGSKKEEEYEDYEEEAAEKKKAEAEAEQRENEIRKAKILSSVDELKLRHAEEQRAISEKAKEEEIFREERERDRIIDDDENDKYNFRGKKRGKLIVDYDEYQDKEPIITEKYKVKPFKTTTFKSIPTSRQRIRSAKTRSGRVKETYKVKTPRLYMMSEELISSEETTSQPTTSTTTLKTTSKHSSRYSLLPIDNMEDSYISLVPKDNNSKDGEPTLFFPVKKPRRRAKTTTISPDTFVAETNNHKDAKDVVNAIENDFQSQDTKNLTTFDIPASDSTDNVLSDITATSNTEFTAPDVTASGSTSVDVTGVAEETASSVQEAESTNSDVVTDAASAASDHNKEEKKDHHYEKGGGREGHEEHENEHEEHEKKAYEGTHKDTKTSKGHHDKEDHLGKYDDHGGFDKHHHDQKDHYGSHHHEENGKKHAEYEESGKHSKGHSTKGSHDIHKKEEYEKNVEFFEEDGDSGEEEKHGGYHQEKNHGQRGRHKKGNLRAGHSKHSNGETGHFGKAGHSNGHKDQHDSGGFDGHGNRGHQHFHKEGKQSGKRWIYHHGYPARTANLVVIDRRADKYSHGPQYFGLASKL